MSPQATTAKDLTGLFAEANTCVLTPSTTQGPYCFDADKIRQGIREDRQGKRLRGAVKVQDSETCRPLPDVVVEIWHCDAAGLCSGGGVDVGGAVPSKAGRPRAPPERGPGGGMPAGGADMGDLTPTDDKRYLRGAQVTNADGIVEFTTIWPGWYAGRTTHIHAMVHVGNERTLTTQVMFDEALNGEVYAEAPCAEHTGRDTFNDDDGIFEESMLMRVLGEGDGYLGAIVFGVDPDGNGK